MENSTSFLPNVNRFYTDGAYTTTARDQMPSISAPNWATTITGMGPEETGVGDNSWEPQDDNPPNVTSHYLPPISGRGKVPETMWRVAKTEDSSVVVAVAESWYWIDFLVEKEIVNFNYDCAENDSLCAQEMSKFVKEHKPNLMFIHFLSIDEAGHAHSWGSPEYYKAVKNVDGYIGEIMQAFEDAGIYDETLFILTADHGGYGFSHGQFNEVCMFIPALFMGPQVKKGYQITSYTTDKDFAPTALNALGLHPGQYMVGKVVEEIYQ